jgi:hypothetical protein
MSGMGRIPVTIPAMPKKNQPLYWKWRKKYNEEKYNGCEPDLVAISPASQNAPNEERTRKARDARMENAEILFPNTVEVHSLQTLITKKYEINIDRVEKVMETTA